MLLKVFRISGNSIISLHNIPFFFQANCQVLCILFFPFLSSFFSTRITSSPCPFVCLFLFCFYTNDVHYRILRPQTLPIKIKLNALYNSNYHPYLPLILMCRSLLPHHHHYYHFNHHNYPIPSNHWQGGRNLIKEQASDS